MAKSKSQWDFGELFPPEPTRKVLSVSELTAQVKRLLEKQVGSIWVTGEVTNLRAQSSGHIYFTLKDAASQLSCVLFSRENVLHRELLADGQEVLLQGDVTVYEARGQYQLIVRAVELQGVGALQIAFEKLKQKLAAEGLFAPERKRPLPKYPQRIGLATSPAGAAIRDVLHVVQRRNPGLEIILAPCRVQGDGAAAEIAAAIRLLNEFNVATGYDRRQKPDEVRRLPTAATNELDLLLVTRGGGSLEDLWAFNDEAVARAIFESAIPVVSAVGHEIDFTISDFVADVRAATPSAAAEIITEGVFASREFVADAPELLRWRLRQRLDGVKEDFNQVQQRLQRVHPRRRVNEGLQRLDDLHIGLLRCAKQGIRDRRAAWQNSAGRLTRLRPVQIVARRRETLLQSSRRLQERARIRLEGRGNEFTSLETRLRLLGPEQVLGRGYSITTDAATGRVLRDARVVRSGQKLKTRLKSGEIRSRVEK
ncbi:MAG: exodeoxyribonuclease VII large subunit [Verrucomicrobia bacterium]|jgi:exodeoxyribonuclease VII large subunit|nr:exodeoxyribonuclease VII large subunit [Verrucomicrobiota bacterium]